MANEGKFDILRIHRNIFWGTDTKWNIEPYSFINRSPMSRRRAVEYCAYISEQQRLQRVRLIRTLNQAIKIIPDIQEVQAYVKEKGTRVIFDKFLQTIDIYCVISTADRPHELEGRQWTEGAQLKK